MKQVKSLPIYVLSGALIFVGITSGSQANGATSSSKQIQVLQNKVKTLETDLDNLAEQIGLANVKISTLQKGLLDVAYKPGSASLSDFKESSIKFVAIQGFLSNCPLGSVPADIYSSSFSAGGKTLVECRMTVLTK